MTLKKWLDKNLFSSSSNLYIGLEPRSCYGQCDQDDSGSIFDNFLKLGMHFSFNS